MAEVEMIVLQEMLKSASLRLETRPTLRSVSAGRMDSSNFRNGASREGRHLVNYIKCTVLPV
jgi:hypothetical protein